MIFLDTGYYFLESLRLCDRIVEELNSNLKLVQPGMSREETVQRHGNDLYRRDPDLCRCSNKVEPVRRATEDLENPSVRPCPVHRPARVSQFSLTVDNSHSRSVGWTPNQTLEQGVEELAVRHGQFELVRTGDEEMLGLPSRLISTFCHKPSAFV